MSRSKVLAVLLLAGLISVLIPLSIVLALEGGGVTVRDSDETEFSNKLSDTAMIELHGLPALAPDKAYEGWLVSDEGPQSTGILTPDTDGNVSQSYMVMDSDGNPTWENLYARFHTFVISIEPVPDTDGAPHGTMPRRPADAAAEQVAGSREAECTIETDRAHGLMRRGMHHRNG